MTGGDQQDLKMTILTRQEAFDVVDSERDYQETRWGYISKENRSLPEYFILIEAQIQTAKEKIINDADKTAAMDEMRKIAAIAIATIEKFGAFKR